MRGRETRRRDSRDESAERGRASPHIRHLRAIRNDHIFMHRCTRDGRSLLTMDFPAALTTCSAVYQKSFHAKDDSHRASAQQEAAARRPLPAACRRARGCTACSPFRERAYNLSVRTRRCPRRSLRWVQPGESQQKKTGEETSKLLVLSHTQQYGTHARSAHLDDGQRLQHRVHLLRKALARVVLGDQANDDEEHGGSSVDGLRRRAKS